MGQRKNPKQCNKAAAEIPIHCKYDEVVPLDSLKPHPANPSRHPEAQVKLLADIIKAHGIRHEIVVSKNSGFIVSEHCRLMAAQQLGLKTFPVTFQSYAGKSEELAVLVADNRIQELAEIDGSKMGDILVELDQVNYPLELTALTKLEIRDYIEGPLGEPNPQDDIVPDLPNCITFVVTREQRIEIENTLDKYDGQTMTERLLCLIRSK
jgi:hypothetical protein